MQEPIGATNLTDIVQPKPQGEPVNNHVVPAWREPTPDYEAMRRLVATIIKEPKIRDEHREPAAV